MEENMQSVSAPQQEEAPVIPPSEFRGTTLQLIGWRLLGILLSIVTLGIGAPWAQCMVYRWEAKHTYVSGKQLHFDGKGHQLLGKYLLWGLLTLVTLGIYALFIPVRMHKWHAGHTRFATPGNEAADTVSGAMIFGFVMAGVAGVLLIALLATLLLPRLTQNGKPALPDLDSFFDRITAKDEDPQYSEEEFFFGQEGVTSYIIDNGDGTFTVIYGNLPTGPAGDQSGNVWAEDTPPQDQPGDQQAYSFTDDPRIIGSWLMRAVFAVSDQHSELEAAELALNADGTFSYFKDIFSGGSSGWHPDGLSDSYSRGTYTFCDGVLTLHYTEYYSQLYSSEPGSWKPTDRTVTQTINFTDDAQAICFSSFSDVMNHNGYFEPINYCPRIVGSIGATLDAIYPNGLN